MELQSKATSIITNEYGHKIAISCMNDSIIILSSQNLQKISEIVNLDSTPYSVSYSSASNGSILAAGFADGSVRLYQESREIYRFNSQKGAILSVAYHPVKNMVAAASLDGTFAVISKEGDTWNPLIVEASKMGLSAIAWGSDSDIVQTIIVGGCDGVVRVFRSAGGGWEMTCAAQVHNGWVRKLSSPKVPAGGMQKVASTGDDHIAYVEKIVGNTINVQKIAKFDKETTGVSWAVVDKVIVLSHEDNTVSIYTENNDGEWILSQDD